MPANTHQHSNWVFTAEGRYTVTIGWTARLKNGQQVSSESVLHFTVGNPDNAPASNNAQGAQNGSEKSTAKNPVNGTIDEATGIVTKPDGSKVRIVGKTASGEDCALTSQELANAQKAAAAGKLPNTGVVIDPFMVSTSIADPHSYEPSLRDIRDVAYARCALTNGLLLEQRKLSKMVEANLPAGVVSVAVAEKIEQYGGKLEAIVEDASLDSIWLGLRVEEGGQNESAPTDSSDAGMRFEVQSVRARTSTDSSNAQLAAFITQTFGAVEMLCDSHARGVNLTREGDTAIRTGDIGSLELPLQAHTHLSWAFSDAGEYAIELSATAVNAPESVRSSRGTLYCVVGRDPQQLVDRLAKEQNVSASDIKVLSAGHADITARTGDGRLVLRADSSQGAVEHELNRTVVAVPSRTLQEVPAGGSYRFLRSGASEHRGQVYLLAQAVLGKHVHGEIDPHIWHSVPNAKASVQVIRDALISADPAGSSEYATRTEQVMKELDALDAQLHQVYGALPESARNLVTTHDGYRYLAYRGALFGHSGCAGSSLRTDDVGECSHDCAVLGEWRWAQLRRRF